MLSQILPPTRLSVQAPSTQGSSTQGVDQGVQGLEVIEGNSNNLTQDDFLQLLVAELSNQDPLNPDGYMDYFAQMAQYTNLEQTKELSSSLQRIEANSLIGKKVDIKLENDLIVSGYVGAVGIEAGKPQVEVDGEKYDLDRIINVLSPENNNKTLLTHNLNQQELQNAKL